MRVRAISRTIVMVGKHSRKISNLDSGRATLCVIGSAVSCHHVGSCLRWGTVQACCRDLSHSCISASDAVHSPCDAEILRISCHRGPELLLLSCHHHLCQ